MFRHHATLERIRAVLKDDFLSAEIIDYQLIEQVAEGAPCEVTIRLRHTHDETVQTISGRGVGMVDAVYHGLIDHYAQNYPSLETIQITHFEVKSRMDTSEKKGADAVGVVSLTVTNSDGRTFEFEQSGRSIVASAIGVTVEALEFFVNSERAFIRIYKALRDAKARRRSDLVQGFTATLAELVNTTSYTQIIEDIKAEML
ncbi:MAG: hypothetical protein ACE366_30920 [Bradymonadia bacterium]